MREEILLCGHSNGKAGYKITRPIDCSLRIEVHVRTSLYVPPLTERNANHLWFSCRVINSFRCSYIGNQQFPFPIYRHIQYEV